MKVVFPNTYEEWLDLMKSNAKEVLSRESIEERIKVLSDSNNTETIQFRHLYGDKHRQKVLAWFNRASQKFKK